VVYQKYKSPLIGEDNLNPLPTVGTTEGGVPTSLLLIFIIWRRGILIRI